MSTEYRETNTRTGNRNLIRLFIFQSNFLTFAFIFLPYIRKGVIYEPVILVRPDADLAAVEAVDAFVPSNAPIFKKEVAAFRYVVSGRSMGSERNPICLPLVRTYALQIVLKNRPTIVLAAELLPANPLQAVGT